MSRLLSTPLLFASALLVSSCSIPQKQAAQANPLVGTWKFDFTGSVVHNAAYAANAGLTDAQQSQTKKLIDISNDSSVIFTEDTITAMAGGSQESMKYTVKSADANGNVIIANEAGQESTYSVSGNTLINTVPDYHFVAVYKKQ